MKIAAIDIGSNAARLLINDVIETKNQAPQFVKVNLLRVPLRLGMDVFSTGKISPARVEMTLSTMKIFKELMSIYQVQHFRACATSAMRDAANGQELIKKIKKSCDIPIEIISGEAEATLVFENHIAENLAQDKSYLYIDVGGGSTELNFYEKGKIRAQQSFNIGTIRVLNDLVKPETWQQLENFVSQHIRSKFPIMAIGSGGNINKVFSLSKTKDGKPMHASYLKNYHAKIMQMTLEERMKTYNLREDRADVLVPALEIFNKIMDCAKITKIFVPKISVADGLIKKIYAEIKATNSENPEN